MRHVGHQAGNFLTVQTTDNFYLKIVIQVAVDFEAKGCICVPGYHPGLLAGQGGHQLSDNGMVSGFAEILKCF